jgi:peptidylprolyl isomerase
MRRTLVSLATLAFLALPAAAQAPKQDPSNTLVLELKTGPVAIQLRPDLAPQHVARVKQLAKEGFYDGLKFHRVIPNFMAQSGDPRGTGTGGSKYPDLPAEFTPEVYKRGTVGAARTQNPNSANSQFFICFNDSGCRGLTGQYTVWGQVISGMENVDKITPGEPPTTPDTIQRAYIQADKK